jgi:hypothetical protein
MSELFVGKKESNIVTFFGKKIKIEHDELHKIDYCYHKIGYGGGYLDFTFKTGKIIRFEFNYRVNDKINRAITFINENNPSIEFNEYDAREYKVFQKDWFIMLMLFFCCFPIGIFLLWYYRKYSTPVRIAMTTFFIGIWVLGIYSSFSSMNAVYNEIESGEIYSSILDEANKEAEALTASIAESLGYNSEDSESEDSKSSDEPEVYEVGDVFESNTAKIMYMDSGDYTTDNEYLAPKSGNKYIYAEFSIENLGDNDYSVGSVSFSCYADDTDCPQSVLIGDDTMTSITTLSPGRNTKGRIYFEVPTNSSKIEIEFEPDVLDSKKIYFIVK